MRQRESRLLSRALRLPARRSRNNGVAQELQIVPSAQRQLWRGDDDLAGVGEHSRLVLDVNADRAAVRTEPEHKANRRMNDDAVREVFQLYAAVPSSGDRGR